MKRILVFGIRCTSYIHRIFLASKALSEETGISYPLLFVDMIWVRFRYSIDAYHYDKYHFYEKNIFVRGDFLTTEGNFKVCDRFNLQSKILLMKDKEKFNRLFSDFVGRRWLYVPDASDEDVAEFLRQHDQFIVKPNSRSLGAGIYKMLSSEITDLAAFCESARKDGVMLEEIVVQHPVLSSLHPLSVNTLRICTVIDKQNVPHVLFANLRMGRGDLIVDNMMQGGIEAEVDVETGIISTFAFGDDLHSHIKHPTSGVTVPGYAIPHWDACKEMVLKAAKIEPDLRYIGWDVAVTEKGPLLIEGNHRPDAKVMQLPSQKGIRHILQKYL